MPTALDRRRQIMAHLLGSDGVFRIGGLRPDLRIYEINARLRGNFDRIAGSELKELAALGFDWIWPMGVWQIGEGARKISRIISADFEGSPYAVESYQISRSLGGQTGFEALVDRAHAAGLKVMVDFVTNHTALDSPWIDEDPDYFIRSNASLRKQSTGEYFLHPSGEVIAYGRDPYFPPWHDTAQLDYSNPALRARMIDVLKRISRTADGVRCDMAMLVLRDYFRTHWYAGADQNWFDERMPGEFWDEAIGEVKSGRPDFLFIAEAYWDKEEQLLDLGFDMAYEKKLYDGLAAASSQAVIERLRRNSDALAKSVCFIENHDEPRAASVFTPAGNLASAALVLSLPGAALVHEGQIEGKRERLPVQILKPRIDEPVDMWLSTQYRRLLEITSQEVFRRGSFELFESGVYGVVSFIRRDENRAIAYLGQVSEAWHRFDAVQLNLSALAKSAGASHRLRVTSLLASRSITIGASEGVFQLSLEELGLEEGSLFCLLEASPA